MSSTSTKPELVAKFDEDRTKLKANVLEEMIKNAKAKDKQVVVISITGVFRSGKSFLLNLLETYLEYYSKVDAFLLKYLVIMAKSFSLLVIDYAQCASSIFTKY